MEVEVDVDVRIELLHTAKRLAQMREVQGRIFVARGKHHLRRMARKPPRNLLELRQGQKRRQLAVDIGVAAPLARQHMA